MLVDFHVQRCACEGSRVTCGCELAVPRMRLGRIQDQHLHLSFTPTRIDFLALCWHVVAYIGDSVCMSGYALTTASPARGDTESWLHSPNRWPRCEGSKNGAKSDAFAWLYFFINSVSVFSPRSTFEASRSLLQFSINHGPTVGDHFISFHLNHYLPRTSCRIDSHPSLTWCRSLRFIGTLNLPRCGRRQSWLYS